MRLGSSQQPGTGRTTTGHTMPHTVTTVTTVFDFAELSADAQQHVADRFGTWAWEDGYAVELCQEDAITVAEDAGFVLDPVSLRFDLYRSGATLYRATGTVEHDGRTWDVYVDGDNRYVPVTCAVHGIYIDQDHDADVITWQNREDAATEHAAELVGTLTAALDVAFQLVDDHVSSVDHARDTADANDLVFTAAGDYATP